MKANRILIAAAAAGLMLGAVACTESRAGGTSGDAGMSDSMEKHACKGMNSCKGKGGCKTDANACKGMNACKGKGGCKTG